MTKKIRIAVACDSDGNCNAAHWSGPAFVPHRGQADDWASQALDGLEPTGLDGLVWVEAEIPLPAEQTVTGTAVLEPIAQPSAEAQPAVTGPEALADRLEEAALASLPFGSGELAQALAEANAVRRGDQRIEEERLTALSGGLPDAYDQLAERWEGGQARARRDARIARAAEGLIECLCPAAASPDFYAAWDRLVEAVESGTGEADALARFGRSTDAFRRAYADDPQERRCRVSRPGGGQGGAWKRINGPAGADGGLGQQGHIHNGSEQAFTRKLVDYLRGGAPDGSGLAFKGGTGNHIALARTYAYAYSAPLGRPLLLEFLEAQEEQGHMSYGGGRNEINTSSHWSWWAMAMAAAWLLALRRQDAAVLASIRRWWRAELALERLGADADGHVELPDARDFHGDADQRKQRNIGRAIILGLKGQVARVPKTAGSPDGGPLSTDMAGVWALTVIRKEFPGEFVSQMANIGNPDLPLLRDTMHVLSTKDQSTIWFETISDAIDCCWWVHRRPGVLAYGIDPARRSGAPGGPRPAGVPEPPGVEGEGPVRLEVKGAN